MIYVMNSKDGIFYEKIRLKNDIKLTSEQIEVDKETWFNTELPCKMIDGKFISTDEYPILEFPEMEVLEYRPTTKERIEILEAENTALNAQLTDTQLALCDVYEYLITLTEK